jgi:hypothetical protein
MGASGPPVRSITMTVTALGGDETAQVPYAFWRYGSSVAVRGQRTDSSYLIGLN